MLGYGKWDRGLCWDMGIRDDGIGGYVTTKRNFLEYCVPCFFFVRF